MTHEEKIALLEEVFEEEAGTITPDLKLEQLYLDSLAVLELIAVINERFGKQLDGAQIESFETVQDILSVME